MDPMLRRVSRTRWGAATIAALVLAACSGNEDAKQAAPCRAGEEVANGACVEALRRYEPEERIDVDNVVAYGDMPRTLVLPDPPKSGFRLIVPPQPLGPGAELEDCRAWAYPNIKYKSI